ncbi:hypothetical protein [Roseobacter fucihabitans]|nr:hypothetical protein [Roseobacter litoralis]
MDTLRAFVKTLQGFPSAGEATRVWNKPDKVSAGFEHRTLSLSATRTRPQTDVYELYWAHLANPSEEPTFTSWLISLFRRNPDLLPPRFRKVQKIGLIALVSGMILAIWAGRALPLDATLAALITLPLSGLLLSGIGYWLTGVYRGKIVDISRYFDSHPKNVQARNEVRKLGVDFLRGLHESPRRYGRIVVCGHSIGSAIGYDILQKLWFEMHETHKQLDCPKRDAKKALRRAIKNEDWSNIQTLQAEVFDEQLSAGNPWLVTDFVTLGSPLAHGDLLLASSLAAFRERLTDGELARCPPVLDLGAQQIGFMRKYQIEGGDYRSIELLPHHALFAVTRWTNIYFSRRFWLFGDPIAGPLKDVFGPGIRDVVVQGGGYWPRIRHNDYWRSDLPLAKKLVGGASYPLDALDDALRLDPVQKEMNSSDLPEN